jgi:hypothetical protein
MSNLFLQKKFCCNNVQIIFPTHIYLTHKTNPKIILFTHNFLILSLEVIFYMLMF